MTIETNFIKVDMAKAKEEAHEKRRINTNHLLGEEKQPDTKITIDKMIAIPSHTDEGVARREGIMASNDAAKALINEAKDAGSLKQIMIDEGYTE